MSRFKNEIRHLESHIKTLRIAIISILILAIFMGLGWLRAPKNLTIHVPPDLRSGSTRAWWDVPPESVYTFAFYIFQQLNRWPTDGDTDYSNNIHVLSPYFTQSCQTFLNTDYQIKRDNGELRRRIRGIYEIPGRGYSDDPLLRVRVISNDEWLVTLDVAADEYFGSEQVKRALVRYPLRIVKMDIDPERNPFGLAIDCYDSTPQRIELSASIESKSSNTLSRSMN